MAAAAFMALWERQRKWRRHRWCSQEKSQLQPACSVFQIEK
jgi:hypothetical protein